MDKITKLTKEIYEAMPFPYGEVKEGLLYNLFSLMEMTFAEAAISDSEISTYSFFDAGCGSGHRLLGLASHFPNAKFTGIDISDRNIEVAKIQAQKNDIHNVTFRQGDILEINDSEKYDVVISNGVIHFLSDPQRGVKNLTNIAKEDGLVFVLVYHPYGEHERYLEREVVQTLNKDKGIDSGMQIIQDLGYSVSTVQYGLHSFLENISEKDFMTIASNAYLTPRETLFTFQEGIDLFSSTDMDWVAINTATTPGKAYFIQAESRTLPHCYKLSGSLKTDYLKSLFDELSIKEKLRIIELLMRPTVFSMVSGKDIALKKVGLRLEKNMVRINKT